MERAIRALIVDDDSSARNILQKFLEIDEKVQVVASESNTRSGMTAIEKLMPDVIFLDINMPREDGLQFAKKLVKLKNHPEIIFTTAYRNFAAEAFSLKPIDFLIKPFGLNDIFDVTTKIEDFFSNQEELNNKQKVWGTGIPEKLKFKTFKGYSFINPKEIIYVKVVGANTEFVMLNNEKERVHSILTDVYEELIHFNFLKINRSVAINLSYIDRIERKSRICVIKNADKTYEFPVTRNVFKYFESMKSVRLG